MAIAAASRAIGSSPGRESAPTRGRSTRCGSGSSADRWPRRAARPRRAAPAGEAPPGHGAGGPRRAASDGRLARERRVRENMRAMKPDSPRSPAAACSSSPAAPRPSPRSLRATPPPRRPRPTTCRLRSARSADDRRCRADRRRRAPGAASRAPRRCSPRRARRDRGRPRLEPALLHRRRVGPVRALPRDACSGVRATLSGSRPAFERDRAHEQIRVGTDVRTWEEDESPYALVAQALKDRGADRPRRHRGDDALRLLGRDRAGGPAVRLASATPGDRGVPHGQGRPRARAHAPRLRDHAARPTARSSSRSRRA